ncbi:MAG: YfhO family protein [Clostridia bacterium]|nr:YfhO family protein [Clostridia bacterium]
MKTVTEKKVSPQMKKTLLWAAAAGALTLAVSLVVLALKKIHPFGENSLVFSDMASEYLPFLTEFYDKVKTGGSLFWSWKTGIGGNFWGNYAYYLTSPFNLIIFLFRREQLQAVMVGLLFFKQVMSAGLMSLFLSLRRGGKTGLFACLFGVAYAFCGWFMAYYQDVIWIDMFFVVPLLALSIERLVDTFRPWLFLPVLLFILFSDFYIAWFACLFAVIYFLYYTLLYYPPVKKDGNRKKKNALPPEPFFKSHFMRAAGVFTVSSAAAALLLGWLFVPVAIILLNNKANDLAIPCAAWFTNLPEQASDLFSGSSGTACYYAQFPNIYMGVLALAALPVFFLSKKITPREKWFFAAVIALYFCSFNVPFLDYLWHGGRYPTGMPFRQSSQYTLFLLAGAHSALTRSGRLEKKEIAGIAVSGGVLMILGGVYLGGSITRRWNLTAAGALVTALLFVAFTVLIALYLKKTKKGAAVLSVLLTALVCVDAGYTFFCHMEPSSYASYDVPVQQYTAVRTFSSRIDDPSLFYRSTTLYEPEANYGALLDFNGVETSTSMADPPQFELLTRLGDDSTSSNLSLYSAQTPLFNSLMGVKYLYEDIELTEKNGLPSLSDQKTAGYTLLGEANGFRCYRNENALPLGYLVPEAVRDWAPEDGSVPENQNGFFALAAGSDGLLTDCPGGLQETDVRSIEVTKTDEKNCSYSTEKSVFPEYAALKWTFTVERDGPVYLYAEHHHDGYGTWKMAAQRETGEDLPLATFITTTIQTLCVASAGETISVWLIPTELKSGTAGVRLLQADEAAFAKACETIRNNGVWALDAATDTCLHGTVDVKDDGQLLMTTVPAADGWTVRVDGAEVPEDTLVRIGGALIGVPLEKGEHEVEMVFSLPGFPVGIIVSSVTAIAFAAVLLLLRRKRRSAAVKAEEA